MAINRIITDPEALDKMIARYEQVIAENTEVLDKLLNGRSYENQIAEWEEKLSHAKKGVESANKEASELLASAQEMLSEAQDQIKLAAMTKDQADKEADKNNLELAKLKERDNQINKLEKSLIERETEIENIKSELVEWVAAAKLVLSDFPG